MYARMQPPQTDGLLSSTVRLARYGIPGATTYDACALLLAKLPVCISVLKGGGIAIEGSMYPSLDSLGNESCGC